VVPESAAGFAKWYCAQDRSPIGAVVEVADRVALGLGNDMKRYLVHHDEGGTCDPVIVGDRWTVENIHGLERKSFTIEEFEESKDGVRMAQSLTLALARATPV
jgi:hypothetical protein